MWVESVDERIRHKPTKKKKLIHIMNNMTMCLHRLCLEIVVPDLWFCLGKPEMEQIDKK